MNRLLIGLLLALMMLALAGCGAGGFTAETLLADRDLVGYDVQDQEGGRIGRVASLIVDLDDGEIEYVVIELPTHPRASAAHVLLPMPWRALELDREAHVLVAAVNSYVLRDAPRFESLPDTRQPDWDVELRQYWEQQ